MVDGLDLGQFAQFGVTGVIAVLGIVFAKGAYQRERDRADRLETENQRLHETLAERVIPALLSASRAAEESAELLAAMQRERDVARAVEQQQQRQRGGT